MTSPSEPQLAAPGAGLPGIELFIARRLFTLNRLLGSREKFISAFKHEREVIRRLVAACETSKLGERVLIPRMRGMEDSSRYWSVWMTLDHLRITNEAFALVIASLTQDRVPKKKASTADVKPSVTVTADVDIEYERSCDSVLAAVAAAPDLRTKLRFDHPWFGPLDAFGWHALTGIHMGIHRGQIERIIAGLA